MNPSSKDGGSTVLIITQPTSKSEFQNEFWNSASPVSKFRRFSKHLHILNLLKRNLPESCHKPPTKRRKIKKLHRKKWPAHTSTYRMSVSGSHSFKKNRQKTIPPEPKESTNSKIPRSHTSENCFLLFTVILSCIPALGNNRRKSKKEQLKASIFPKIRD